MNMKNRIRAPADKLISSQNILFIHIQLKGDTDG